MVVSQRIACDVSFGDQVLAAVSGMDPDLHIVYLHVFLHMNVNRGPQVMSFKI